MPTWSYFAAMTAVCRAMHTFTHTHRYTHAYSHTQALSLAFIQCSFIAQQQPAHPLSSILIYLPVFLSFHSRSFALACALYLSFSLSLSLSPSLSLFLSLVLSIDGHDNFGARFVARKWFTQKYKKKNWLCSKEFRIGGNTSFSATFCAIPGPLWLISGLFNKPGPRSVVWRDLCNHCRPLLLHLIDSGYPVEGTGYRRLLYFANSQWALLLCHVRAIYLCCTTWGASLIWFSV